MDSMSGTMSWTDMLTGGDDVGLKGFNFNMTQETQQIDEMPTEGQVDDVQGRASAPRPRSSRSFSKRTKNFEPLDDEVVVSAWLNASKDPMHGANQSKASFWKRIHKYYEKNKKTSAYRTESSIMHRWMTILTQVNKYCGCYEQTELRNQSGATIQDMASQASEMFKGLDQDNKSFTLMHCWNKLKDEDKWKVKRQELADQKKFQHKKQKVQPHSTPREAEGAGDGKVREITPPQSEERKRPMSQKKEKEAIRQGGEEACMEALDKMWAKKEAFDMEKEKKKEERYMASLELDKKRLALEEKMVEVDMLEKEDKIMAIDMISLSPLQKQYYQHMEKKIVARRLSN